VFTKADVNSQRNSECEWRNHFDDREQSWLDDVHDRSAYSHKFRIVQTGIGICDPSKVRAGLPVLLMTKGGQSQLYLPEAASTSVYASEGTCSSQMPPQLPGGFFVAIMNNR